MNDDGWGHYSRYLSGGGAGGSVDDGWDHYDRYLRPRPASAPVPEASAPVQRSPSGGGIKRGLSMLGRGLAESGYATAEGVGTLAAGALDLIGADKLAAREREVLDRRRRQRDEMREFYGEPESTGDRVIAGAGRMAGELAQYMIPGAAAGRIAKGSRFLNPTTFTGKVGRDFALGAPVTAAMAAGSPEASTTGGLAELTGSETLQRMASSPIGRVTGDLALDVLTGAGIQGVSSLAGKLRGRGALDTDFVPVGESPPVQTVNDDPLPRLQRPQREAPAGLIPERSSARLPDEEVFRAGAEGTVPPRSFQRYLQPGPMERVRPDEVFEAGPAGVRKPFDPSRALPAVVRDAEGVRIPDHTTIGGERAILAGQDELYDLIPDTGRASDFFAGLDDPIPAQAPPAAKPAPPRHFSTRARSGVTYTDTRARARKLNDEQLVERYHHTSRTVDVADARAMAYQGKGVRVFEGHGGTMGVVGTGAGAFQRGSLTQAERRLAAYHDELLERGLELPHGGDSWGRVKADDLPFDLQPEAAQIPSLGDDELLRRMKAAGDAAASAPDNEERMIRASLLYAELRRRGISDEYGFASRELMEKIAGAGLGAATGAAIDEDNHLRGALVGGALGAGAAHTARGALAGAGKAVPIPESLQAAYRRASSSIDFSGALAKQSRRDNAPFSTRLDRVFDQIANRHGPIERLGRAADDKLRPSRNPRDLLTHWRNAPATVQRAFKEGVVDPTTRQVIGPSLKDVVAPLGEDPEAVQQAFVYAINERLLGRGLPAFGGNAKKMADAEQLVKHFREQPQMQEFKKRLGDYTEALGEYAKRSGLWTEAQWKAIRDSDALYTPIQRIMNGGGTGSRAGDGLMNVTSGVRRFTGSDRDIADPVTTLTEYTAEIINRADRYRVGHAVIDAVQALGEGADAILTPVRRSGAKADVRRAKAMASAKEARANLSEEALEALDELLPTKIDSKNPVIWRNGPNGREEFVVNAPDLLDALTGLNRMDNEGLRKVADTVLLPLKRVFTATTTGLAPSFFAVTNPARDVVDLLAKTESGVTLRDIAEGYAHGIGGAFGKSQFAERMRNFGLGNVSLWHDAAHSTPAAAAREIAPTTRGQKIRGAARKGSLRYSGVTLLESFGNATEAGFRLGEAQSSLRKNQARVDAGEWSIEDLLLRAGTEGREKIDFTNRPGNAVLRELTNYVPFFGAALQGTATMTQAALRDPKRVASVAGGIATAALVSWALKHRSEEVLARENDRLPAERAGFLFIPMDEAGRYTIRVPLSQELGLVAAGVTAGLDALVSEDPHAAEILIQSINRALPPGIGDLVTERELNPSIPGVQQLAENMRNRRYFDGGPVEPRSMEQLPAAERRRDSTPYTADLLAAGARKAGFSETSPLQAENLMRGVTSRFTPIITAATDPVARRVMGRDAAPPRVPAGVSRNALNPGSALLANPTPSTTASEQRFFETRQRVQQAEAAIRQAMKGNDRALAERTVAEYRDVLDPQVRQTVRLIYQESQKYREASDAVRAAFQAGEIDGARAREILDQIGARRAHVFRQADRVISGRQLQD